MRGKTLVPDAAQMDGANCANSESIADIFDSDIEPPSSVRAIWAHRAVALALASIFFVAPIVAAANYVWVNPDHD